MPRTRRLVSSEGGQMMVELAVMIPVLVAVAAVAINAVLFFSECAAFDRIARNAIRIESVSPAYGQDAGESASLVQRVVDDAMHISEKDYLESSVSVSGGVGGRQTFHATISFSPTLFGLGLKSSVFGVALPRIEHSAELTVECYRPGMLF